MENIQSPARVACIQMEVAQSKKAKNLDTARRMVREAARSGATLMVLPELFNSGSMLDSRAEAFSLAEPVPNGPTTQMLLELSREYGVYLVGSLLERKGPDIYNTAVLTGPEGLVGKYRKLHPCEEEVYWVEPGDLGLPVFHTPIGRIARLICLVAYYP